MTAYTAIPDSDIDPESPGTTTLFTRLRDNPIAIAEGAAGAPSIAYSALSAPVVSGGTTYEMTTPVSESTNSTSYVKLVEWIVSLSGTTNVYFGLTAGLVITAYGRIYVNGSPVGTERSVNNGTTYWSEDITISDGDKIQIYVKSTSTTAVDMVDATLRNATTIPGSIVRTV